MEIPAQDIGVFALHAGRHRLPHEGKGLMTIEAMQFDDLSIEGKTVIGEFGFAKTYAAGVFIDRFAVLQKAHMNGVEHGLAQLPEFDGTKILERDGVTRGVRGCFGAGMYGRARGWVHRGIRVAFGFDGCRLTDLRDRLCPVAQFHLER